MVRFLLVLVMQNDKWKILSTAKNEKMKTFPKIVLLTQTTKKTYQQTLKNPKNLKSPLFLQIYKICRIFLENNY